MPTGLVMDEEFQDEESHQPLLKTLWQGMVIHFEVTCTPLCFGKGLLCTLAHTLLKNVSEDSN